MLNRSPANRLLAALTLGAGLSMPVLAASPVIGDVHVEIPADIVVTAPFERQRHHLVGAVGVLDGDRLALARRATIGETLASQPGVSTTWFGPSASRPVLRGMQGERVRVLTDGIGSFDVSNTSVDHAVAINPLLAERVEVVRGPASLLYGSSAIGGVVNVLDNRIPRHLPEEVVHLDATGTLGTAARERGGAALVDVPIGNSGVVFHADGSYLKSGNMRPGGHVFSERLRAEAAAVGGDVAMQSQARGRIPNTHAETWDAAAGLGFFRDGGSFGFAVSRLESRYGVPNALSLSPDEEHHHHDHDHDHHDHDHGRHSHNDIRLDMRQTRVDARAEIPLGGAFEQMRFRFGWADYRHDEIEESGETGTSFFNNALEARAELVQKQRAGWKGAVGVQYVSRNFDAHGAEAYVPRNSSDQFGIFTLQQFDLGALRAEVGARFEHANVAAPVVNFHRGYNALSLSGGVSIPIHDNWRLAVNLSRSERAPSAEELLARGPHLATRTYSLGDPALSTEKSLGAEVGLRFTGPDHRFELSGYFNRFEDFIALLPAGVEADGLPVYAARQHDARIWGFEAEGGLVVARLGNNRIEMTGLADFVRGDLLHGGGPIPRIPPLRFIAGVEMKNPRYEARFEVEHATRQTRLAAFEAQTPAYSLVNASLTWHPPGLDEHSAIILSANNIFDADARRHASYLKEFAPLLGRDIRLALRFSL